ncbi:hypothetical protein LCGC14_0466350 [marine sediment metagenome]|uniref:Uncharacterized protein n=1 Tax=marine sediment metagenome TaxID=412755 RepID=A0A0F9SDM0_9ZZZZ
MIILACEICSGYNLCDCGIRWKYKCDDCGKIFDVFNARFMCVSSDKIILNKVEEDE